MEVHPLQYLGALLAMVVGVTGLLNPSRMKALVGITHSTKVGFVEIRVLFGSFLVALPLAALVHRSAEIFVFYGIAACSAAIIKSIFTYLDRCPLRDIWLGIVADIILALLLLSSVYL